MRGCKAQAARLRFRVLGKTAFEAEFTFVLAVFLEGVDKEEVGAACGKDPAAVSGDVKTDYGFAKCGDGGFCPDAQPVEHAYVTFVGSDGNVAFFCCGSGGEFALSSILLQF